MQLDHSYADIFNSKAQFTHSIFDVKHDHTYESTINSQYPSPVCNPISVNIQTSCTKDEFATIYPFDKKDHNTSYEYGKNVSSVNKTNESDTFKPQKKLDMIDNTHTKSTTYFKIPKFNSSNIITIDKITYLVYDVAVGGNCFFNALSLGISGNFKQGEIYRNLICKEIYDSYAYWRDQLKVSHFKNISPQKYWKSMVKGKNIAKSPEISVAAKMLNCNINVFVQHKCTSTGEINFTKEEYISVAHEKTLIYHLTKSIFNY